MEFCCENIDQLCVDAEKFVKLSDYKMIEYVKNFFLESISLLNTFSMVMGYIVNSLDHTRLVSQNGYRHIFTCHLCIIWNALNHDLSNNVKYFEIHAQALCII